MHFHSCDSNRVLQLSCKTVNGEMMQPLPDKKAAFHDI